MSKIDVSMTDSEVGAFLDRCTQMVVGVIDADGWPSGTIAAIANTDGALKLRFSAADPLIGLLEAEPKVCCVADEHSTYYDIKGVIAHGRAVTNSADPFVATVMMDRVVSFDFGRLQT